jgi:hypothetical protein
VEAFLFAVKAVLEAGELFLQLESCSCSWRAVPAVGIAVPAWESYSYSW